MSTTNKLAEVIRKIVKDEVRKEIRNVLKEGKKPSTSVDEFNTGLQHALGLTDSVERRARVSKKPKMQYTKNTMLNDILNETAGQVYSGDAGMEEYPTMGGAEMNSNTAQGFDRKSLAAKMGYGDMNPSGTPSIQEMVPNRNSSGGVQHNTNVDPSVAKALTRDYSELVKKFKK